MNADQLLAFYERIADAPDAITRLRRFILDLAVRSKLVEQDPNDESAPELLKRIAAEKARLVRAGESRKSQPLIPVVPAEQPFAVPISWKWVSSTYPAYGVSDLGKKIKTKDVLESGAFPVVDQGKVLVRGYCNDPRKVVKVSEPLIVFGDHTRETKLIDFDFVVGADGVKILQPVGIDARFYHLALQWLPLESRGYSRHFKLLKSSYIPLPPLAEQHRIVAKVDELMALCDRLEVARAEREATRDRLASASLARLNAPDPDPTVFKGHAAFAIENLAPLTTRLDQIKALRQTILNLAVRGKLVEQDPADEPASELLKRITAEKVGGRKKTKPTTNLTSSITGWDVPQGWVIIDLQSVCASITDGDHLPPPKTESGIPFLVIGNVRSQTIEFAGSRFVSPEYYEALDPIRRPRSGDLLYTLVGSYGIPIVVRDDQPFCVQRHIGILRPSKLIDVLFLARAMESRLVFEQAIACATGIAQKTVPLSGLRRLLIPLAPLAEQHRIVAKVDELMALCDRLEANIATGDNTRCRLLDTLLHEVLSPVADQ